LQAVFGAWCGKVAFRGSFWAIRRRKNAARDRTTTKTTKTKTTTKPNDNEDYDEDEDYNDDRGYCGTRAQKPARDF